MPRADGAPMRQTNDLFRRSLPWAKPPEEKEPLRVRAENTRGACTEKCLKDGRLPVRNYSQTTPAEPKRLSLMEHMAALLENPTSPINQRVLQSLRKSEEAVSTYSRLRHS